MATKRLAVFASGNGSNFEAIVRACRSGRIRGEVVLLVCDKPQAYVLRRAKEYGIECKSFEYQPTMDELPEAEQCTAKELENPDKGKTAWIGNSNSVITLVIIVLSCSGIVGGLYLYFTIKEKKDKKAKAESKNNHNKK